MEKLNEVLTSLKERFSNPLIISFLISWLVINWEVPLAILFYNSRGRNGIPQELIDYLSGYSSSYNLIAWPLAFAVGYTILSPIVRNFISAFYTWNTRWGNTWDLSISKGSKVPIGKYVSLRDNYKKRTEVLEEIITNESSSQKKLLESETALLSVRNEANKLSADLALARALKDNLSNVDVIRGAWERKSGLDSAEILNIEISNGNIFARLGTKLEQRYQINSFTYNSDSRSVRFMLVTTNGQFYSFEDLELRNREMVGWEHKTGSRTEVTYTRQ